MKLIVGLGNPGNEYDRTRHNAGFQAIDALAHQLEESSWQKDVKHQAVLIKSRVDDIPVLLVKPQTFMNRSGETVQSLLSYYKIDSKDLLVIHDEMDLAPGRLTFLAKGSAAGHNGVADIQERLATQEITRLRIGVGRPLAPMAKETWVLGVPSEEDRAAIENVIKKTPDAIRDWTIHGLTIAMNRWNGATS